MSPGRRAPPDVIPARGRSLLIKELAASGQPAARIKIFSNNADHFPDTKSTYEAPDEVEARSLKRKWQTALLALAVSGVSGFPCNRSSGQGRSRPGGEVPPGRAAMKHGKNQGLFIAAGRFS